MLCSRCQRTIPDEAEFCPYCGSPVAATAPPSAEAAHPSESVVTGQRPATGGMAQASLWLGIGGLVLFVLSLLLVSMVISPAFSGQLSEREMERLVEQKMTQVIGSTFAFFLGQALSLSGLILGIVGLSREKVQPTRGGRTHTIVGIVLSTLPLACCVGSLLVSLIGLAGS